MGQYIPGGWTKAQDEALTVHIQSGGLSYAQAASRINTEFNTAYSRNAAIGRANRIGLAVPKKPKVEGAEKPKRKYKPGVQKSHQPRVRIVRSNSNSSQLRVIQVSETEQFQPIDNEALDLAAKHISLHDLTEATCKWPYGNGPYTFCGCEKISDGPYCYGHQLRSQQFKFHHELSEQEKARRTERARALGFQNVRRWRAGAVA